MDGISRSRGWDKEIPHGILPMEQPVLSDKRARIKHCKYILRKDNELVHLLHRVTYFTASDIIHFATNLQIYEFFHISE